MIKRELAKDPKLATESWDRFLPKFRRKHLKTSEKTAKKNEKIQEKNEARKAAGLEPIESQSSKPAKKVYTPFPPAQQPRKVDLQLESGEYFLKISEKEARDAKKRKEKVCCLFIFLPNVYSRCLHNSIARRGCFREPGQTRGGVRRPRGDCGTHSRRETETKA